MTFRVGVVGCGAMGQIHLDHLRERSRDVQVVGVTDPNLDLLSRLDLPPATRVFADARDLISDSGVDQIVVASPAAHHAEAVLQAVELGKPVFCEKPLVTTLADSRLIRQAEESAGRRLVWVGFMRRYDPVYRALKDEIDRGRVGAMSYALMSHRNPAVPPTFGNADYMLETFIHEFDVANWLLGSPVTAIGAWGSAHPASSTDLTDPQFLDLRLENGISASIDGHITNGYGYDIRCEVVGEKGSVALTDVAGDVGFSTTPFPSWAIRFRAAYRACLFAWVDDVLAGGHNGATVDDSERALRVALAGIESLQLGLPVGVNRD